jgi:hypothetical protein
MKRLLLCLALALAAGCGQSDEPSAAAPATTTTSTTLPEGPPPERVGQPFDMAQAGLTGPTTLRITVKRPITCGIRGFDLPASEGTGTPARKVVAPEGMRYCRVDLTIRNVGKRTTQTNPSGFMYDDQQREFPADDSLAADLFEREGGNFPGVNTVEVAPTRSAETLMVFAIPVGAAPTGVSIEEGDGEPPFVQVHPGDVEWLNPRGK